MPGRDPRSPHSHPRLATRLCLAYFWTVFHFRRSSAAAERWVAEPCQALGEMTILAKLVERGHVVRIQSGSYLRKVRNSGRW